MSRAPALVTINTPEIAIAAESAVRKLIGSLSRSQARRTMRIGSLLVMTEALLAEVKFRPIIPSMYAMPGSSRPVAPPRIPRRDHRNRCCWKTMAMERKITLALNCIAKSVKGGPNPNAFLLITVPNPQQADAAMAAINGNNFLRSASKASFIATAWSLIDLFTVCQAGGIHRSRRRPGIMVFCHLWNRMAMKEGIILTFLVKTSFNKIVDPELAPHFTITVVAVQVVDSLVINGNRRWNQDISMVQP